MCYVAHGKIFFFISFFLSCKSGGLFFWPKKGNSGGGLFLFFQRGKSGVYWKVVFVE
jgi:hypothetical protein